MEISTAIADLIRHVNQRMPKLLRPLFKTVIQQLVSDDSPVWRGYPEGTTVLDAEERGGGKEKARAGEH